MVMDTMVSMRVVGDPGRSEVHDAIARAQGWFERVESVCSRFDASSEVRQLLGCPGVPFRVSDILFETTQLAIALAAETDGAFDPTIGSRMEARGFDREYRTGRVVRSSAADRDATWRDVIVDEHARTITLARPLVLDLGAVAKGFAVDMAAMELRPFRDFAIDAGGDLYLGGTNDVGEPWTVGIRHPRDENGTIDVVRVSDAAVCTSGDYLRATSNGHHILDPITGDTARSVASATVIAPLAMVADGLATAAFVLGPERGIALLERHGVQGLVITPELERFRTREP
jgi:thiamine biosynthesis lipoprotein